MTRLSHAAALVLLAFASTAASIALAATPAPAPDPAAAVMTVAKDVCLRLLQGGKIEVVAKTTGLKNGRESWVLPLGGKQRIEVSPPSGSNPHVCTATVFHDPDAAAPIIAALTDWAAAQTPPLLVVKAQEKSTGSLYQQTTSSWEGKIAGGDLGMIYAEDKTLAGKSVAGALDQATLMVGLTPSAP
jgi:hypothetical protein